MSAVLAPAASPSPVIPVATPLDTGVRPRRWTREEYYRALEIGLFGPEERLELLNGEILEKVTENAPHATGIKLSAAVCTQAFVGQNFHLSIQHPISLPGAESDPEPDVAVIAGGIRDYQTNHPTAANVLLLIEVSNTTLTFDRGPKAAAYATATVTEYWVLDLGSRCLHVHREPRDGAYQSITPLDENQTVSPLAAPQATIRVAGLLPDPA